MGRTRDDYTPFDVFVFFVVLLAGLLVALSFAVYKGVMGGDDAVLLTGVALALALPLVAVAVAGV